MDLSRTGRTSQPLPPPADQDGCPRRPDLNERPSGCANPGYATFLRLDELLDLQHTGGQHDELLFVVIHQSHELWFKLVLFELESVRDQLLAGRPSEACHGLRRLGTVTELLIGHWKVLDTMLASDYLAFRDSLEGGSGFESVQYREIEFLSGARDPGYLERVPLRAEDRARLQRRLADPSVEEAFAKLVHDRGLRSITEVFRDRDEEGGNRDWPLLQTAELMLDFDTCFARWRAYHSLAVERLIGNKPGTGGSAGVAYLRTRTSLRMFPQLWAVRSSL